MPVEKLRELMPDAVVRVVLTTGVDVKNITTLTRRASTAVRIAAQERNKGRCEVRGCARWATELNHNPPWAETWRTRLDELDSICDDNHDQITYDGFTLAGTNGDRVLVPPGGSPSPDVPDPPSPDGARTRSVTYDQLMMALDESVRATSGRSRRKRAR